VYLVGAGPGAADLLTVRAVSVLQRAEVVVHDRLVDPGIVELAPPRAERVFVGKERARHPVPQSEINAILIAAARAGHTVVRLKGGDPYVFGRGGEEAEALVDAGIPFEVIPGVTAACGVGAYAGIPLTHRDHAHACVFVTGHLRDGTVALDWDALARPMQTVVVYMGLQALPVVCRELHAHGLAVSTPAAMIQQGTTARQRVVCGTLATLPARALAAGLASPSLLIVGEVVRLHDKLSWFDPAVDRAGPGVVTEPPGRARAG
jgi:uroporphyrin-III C-methyltransferase/precorrin-2 dehydrogenase/sirohydrochlorin ferrochelatase